MRGAFCRLMKRGTRLLSMKHLTLPVLLACLCSAIAEAAPPRAHAPSSPTPENAAVVLVQDGDPTPLMEAAFTGNERAARALLEAGADPNVRDRYGRTALWYAVYAAHLDVFKLLIGHPDVGEIVNLPDEPSGDTPLHLAVKSDDEGFTKLLLATGADRGAQNLFGQTPERICGIVFFAGCKGL